LLLREEQPVSVTAKVFEPQVVLVENRGRLMTKGELLLRLWPDTTVEEANLAQNISTLRKTLEDNPKDHRYIATIRGRGYSFVAIVTEIPKQQNMAKPSANELKSPAVSVGNTLPRIYSFHSVIRLVAPVLLIGIAAFFYFRNIPRFPAFYTSVPLTSYVGSEICPSFAPDGERVAFAWDGEKQENFDIYVRQIGDGTLLRLTSDPKPDLSPAWSPDGRTIGFLRFNSDHRAEVLLMSSVAASPPKSLAAITAPMTLYPQLKFLAWSPDSKWLVVSDGPSYRDVMGLFLLSVETGEKRALTLPPKDYDDVDPAFSLNGFARYRGGGTVASDLYVLNLSVDLQPQGSPERLTFYNGHSASPVWTSDGRALLFTRSEQPGNHSIWRISLFGVRKSDPCRCRSIAALFWTSPGEAVDSSLKKECQEKIFPSAQYRPILVPAFSPLFERGFPQGRIPCFVSACEAQIRFLPLWGFIFCRDGAHRFSNNKPDGCPLHEWQRMVATRGPIGDSWPMALFDCPRRHRVATETRVRKARA
jgi:DNA-binding winged helix-turn-helix (wHTH) protein/Tol biopolymer transport system component